MSTTGRTIHVARKQWHLAWDHSIPPIARVDSGAIVEFDCLDASCGQIGPDATVETIHSLDFSQVDQANGPIYVEGAEPGDALEVEFVDFQPADWGWTALIPGFGLLADDFAAPALKVWHLTIPPYRHGGNLDTKYLTRGARLYLPVEVAGALFSMGDGHGAQGDGEVCGTAIETPMRAIVRLTVHKDRSVAEPQFRTAGPLAQRSNIAPYHVTEGINPDIREAARQAVRHMIEYLKREYDMSAGDAYMLCSVAVDLKLCEVVDMPNYVVGAFLPMSIFSSSQ